MIQYLMNMLRICFLIALWLLSAQAQAQADSPVIEISDPDFSAHLAQGIAYLEDPSGNLTLDQVLQHERLGGFQTYQHDNFQHGYSDSAYWLKINLSNQLPARIGQSESDRFIVSVRYPLLDDVRFFHIRRGQSDQYFSGDSYHFHQRFLNLNNFDYPISLEPGEQSQVYIRIQTTSSVSVPLYLETEKAYIENQFKISSLDGIYFGITIGLGIYNLFLWIGVRRKVYGLYVLLIMNLLAFNATVMGFAYRLWPNAIEFQQVSVYLFSIGSAVSMCLFGMAFLRTREYQPGIHKIILTALCVYMVAIPIIFFVPIPLAAKINVAVSFSGLVILYSAAIRSVIQGYRPARYHLIGQGAVLFAVLFTVLTSLGFIPLYSLAPEIMKWATAFELMFFSFGLAELLNIERQLREKAQQESAQAQKLLLQSQIKITEELDTLVRQRTEELELANRRLESLSKIDELTGLYNRRYLNEVFANEYRRAYRENNNISVLVFDIDHFKRINDSYGHAFGDLCLINAAKLIQGHLNRPPDIAFRYGGEEFIILLPNTDIEGALFVAETLRTAIAEMIVSDQENATSMTVSIGVASEVPQQRDSHEAMFKLADQRLYYAKKNGRNQTVAFDEYEEVVFASS